MYINRAWMNPERSFAHDLNGAVHDDWNDRDACRDGEHERALFERAERIGVPSRAFRKYDNRIALPDSLGRHLVGSKRGLSVVALDLDHPRGAHRTAEYRHF